ncbi:conserved hypothetical protein [Halorhabdus utahensis DSM 12940]|uniref:Glycerophosphoryl diester phosphodiesterase membrane domain-containing protein n=1 Tax=Halorhabdus utahensis (strain DSM 12940 / JCM 11049 / AX-2) TaxID=519442 RepID=C7NSB2_HALUD|nr:hypothetical protein [Halorhabdus utahensis]ACV11999.1 conserved hypothetical protein [Halorhabdus utahensis DSM 12940]
MALAAIDRIDDAVDMTRSFLFPFDGGRWLRLAVITFFLVGGSGGGSVFSTTGNVPASTGSTTGGSIPEFSVELPEFTATAVAVALGVIAVLVLLGLIVGAIGAIVEFVFVESLSSNEVNIRAYFGRYLGRGLRLFAFRLVLGAVTFAIFGGAFLLLFGDVIAALFAGEAVSPSIARIVAGVLLLFLLGLVVGIPVALANGFTTEFVVPIMLREDRGVLAAWRRFWPTLTEQWTEYGAYVLVAFGLHIVTGIAGSIVLGLVAVALLVPFAIVAVLVGVGVLQGGVLTAASIAVLAGLLIAYLLVVFVAAAVIYVPIRVFHRQFALLVLGDTNAEFDVLADRRPSGAD